MVLYFVAHLPQWVGPDRAGWTTGPWFYPFIDLDHGRNTPNSII